MPGDHIDEASKPPFQKTESGLQYRILRQGDGKVPGEKSTLSMYLRGWLDDGTEIINLYKQGVPKYTYLGEMIPGMREGLKLLRGGGKIELTIPSELGLGADGDPPLVPPNSTLHYEIDLISVE